MRKASEVRLRDGRTFKAKVRGMDPQSDIAVIKIDAKNFRLRHWRIRCRTHVGEFAIAIGRSLSARLQRDLRTCHAKSRSDVVPPFEGGGLMDQDFIQTDANINRGNSGAAGEYRGEVIGINTLIRGLRTGIGFAIPSSLAKRFRTSSFLTASSRAPGGRGKSIRCGGSRFSRVN